MGVWYAGKGGTQDNEASRWFKKIKGIDGQSWDDALHKYSGTLSHIVNALHVLFKSGYNYMSMSYIAGSFSGFTISIARWDTSGILGRIYFGAPKDVKFAISASGMYLTEKLKVSQGYRHRACVFGDNIVMETELTLETQIPEWIQLAADALVEGGLSVTQEWITL